MKSLMIFLKQYAISAIFIMSALIFSGSAAATTYTVNTTSDHAPTICEPLSTGDCTLREAMMEANANSGLDYIEFNITTDGTNPLTCTVATPCSIKVTSPLPAIRDRVTIDAFTQAGVGVHAVELSGELLPFSNTIGGPGDSISQPTLASSGYSAGLVLWGRDRARAIHDGACLSDPPNTPACKLLLNPDYSIIKGLVINKFPRSAIFLHGADNVTIIGNYLGIDSTGELSGYENGRLLRNAATTFATIRMEGSSYAFIGTTEADYNNNTIDSVNRNIFGASSRDVIDVSTLFGNSRSFGTCGVVSCQHPEIGFRNNVIQGNYFGTDKDGDCIIGGGGSGTSSLSNDPNLLCSPISSTRSLGSSALAINLAGVANFESANSGNIIGGLAAGQGNLIVSTLGNSIFVGRSSDDKIYGNVIGRNAADTKMLWGAIGNGSNSIFASITNNTHIKGNKLYKNGIPYPVPLPSPGGAAGAPGVVISTVPGLIFENNIVDSSGGSGLDIIGTINATIINNTFTNNSFFRTERGGIRLSSFGPGDTISNSNLTVIGNFIGTDATGANKGNNGPGITLITSSPVYVGFSLQNNYINPIPNVIAFNTRAGIVSGRIIQSPTTPHFAALYNIIYANGGAAGALGIDVVRNVLDLSTGILLLGDGPNLNDVNDVDGLGAGGLALPNYLQNFPVLNAQRSFINPALVMVEGSFNGIPDKDFLLQFYSNDTALCFAVSGVVTSQVPGCDAAFPFLAAQGKVFIGEVIVHTDLNGDAYFRTPAKMGVPVGSLITATATSLEMVNGVLSPQFTSEFSEAIDVDQKGSQKAYAHANGAAGGDASQGNDAISDANQAN